jgi:serine/threonine-protein phosphatase PGAM5
MVAGGHVASRFLYLVRHGDAGDDGELTACGEEQARLTGERLRAAPLTAIYHSPKRRAVRTAEIVAGYVPGVPSAESYLLDDYIPSDPDPADLPADYARFVSAYDPAERAAGAELSRSAVATFGGPGDTALSGADEHVLLVTHNFLIGWFVRAALGAPDWRWLGLNQQNCALTVLMYRAQLPASLVGFNDAGHLTWPLRWTGFPDSLRPAAG